MRTSTDNSLPNSSIAELLALAAESAKMPLQKALRRASRKALMWPEEAEVMVQEDRSLTELPAALLAGIKRERILNSMSRDELLNWAASVRHGSARHNK